MSATETATSKRPIRLGFIGLSAKGWAASALAPSLLDPRVREQYKLTAIATTSAESAAAAARKYSELFGHEIKAYHDVDQLAGDPEVDFVAIAVSPLHHKSVTEKWQSGKTFEETKELARLAREKGVKSFIGLQGRQSNVITKVKGILDSGKVGRILSVNVNLLKPLEMNVLAPNCIEQYAWVVDRSNGKSWGPFSRVSAKGTTLFPTISVVDNTTFKPTGKTLESQFPDHFTVTGILKESGAWVTITSRLGHPSTPGRTQLLWEIDGDAGSVRIEDKRLGASHVNVRDPEHIFLNGEEVPWNVDEDGEKFDDRTPFLAKAWLEFSKGKEGGGNFVDIEEAVRHRELMDSIERSLFEGGKWIDV
ncbi:NAD-binding Rossmann fold oxidoreductase [Ephemerocybe angulata]|uniref:NAD-binding Rossmann fold oxidoreductase n=1 Tax=Ephemerocybe angulata TaxID=980116 RepID=A0A8H6HLG5_9AGAR|nr:NAD-binding Rossmann fold oxidoreductase [Tulosesus angulatus]